MSDKQSWIHDFFGGSEDFYGTAYAATGVFDRKDAEKEVDMILDILKPEPGSHILDWCGGWGRHAIPLVKRGFKVTLLDFSREYLDRAETHATQEGVSLNLVHADFRETPPSIQADYAVNLFTAGLGYLGEKEDLVALTSLKAALKPNAYILIDTMNLFWMIRNFAPSNWTESTDGTRRYLQKRTFDFWTNTEYATNTYQDKQAGTERSCNVDLKVYCPSDLARVLKTAGFIPLMLFGDYDGSDFTLTSKRLIMTAGRR